MEATPHALEVLMSRFRSACWPGLAAFLLALSPLSAPAWDFPERPAAVVLHPEPEGAAFGASGFAQTAYRANEGMNTPLDKFQVEAFGHHGIFDLTGVRLSIYYGTHMLNGPVNPGDRPGAEASQWMMNAIQYEYGLVAAWHLRSGGRGRPVLLIEYGRRSYHPLRGGFENPSADILRAGAALMDLRLPRSVPGGLDLMARLAWSELFAFWGASAIPEPRSLYTLHLAAEAHTDLGPSGLKAFLVLMPDLMLLRGGGTDMDLAVQGGLRAGRHGAALEFFLDYHRSSDTEQLVGRPSPATLFGYGIRFRVETGRR